MKRYPCWEIFSGNVRVLMKNATIKASAAENVDAILKVLREDGIDGVFMPLQMLREIMNLDSIELKMNTLVSSGQPFPAICAKITKTISDRLVMIYGCTEIGAITSKEVHNPEELLDYEIGVPLPGIEIKVVNPDGSLIANDEEGEVFVRSSVQFLGYWGDEKRTKEVCSKAGWYKTGDSMKLKKVY